LCWTFFKADFKLIMLNLNWIFKFLCLATATSSYVNRWFFFNTILYCYSFSRSIWSNIMFLLFLYMACGLYVCGWVMCIKFDSPFKLLGLTIFYHAGVVFWEFLLYYFLNEKLYSVLLYTRVYLNLFQNIHGDILSHWETSYFT